MRFKESSSVPSQGSCAQPRPRQEGRGLSMVTPPRGPVLPPPPPTAPPDLRARSLEGAGRPWARLPEIGSTWGDVAWAGPGTRTRPLSQTTPRTPHLQLQARSVGLPGGGAQAASQPPQVAGAAGALSRGLRAARRNRGSPREGPTRPGAGLVQKATCSFLGCLRLLKHTYSHTPRTGYTHTWLHKPAGVGTRGAVASLRGRLLRRTLPQPPLATD